MLQNYKVYTLEDEKDFILIDTLEYNNIKYLLLSSVSNPEYICIRKIIIEENEEYIVKLEEYEFESIVDQFLLKHKDLF
jgi:hypothetical protein